MNNTQGLAPVVDNHIPNNGYVFDPYYFDSIDKYLLFFRAYDINIDRLNYLLNDDNQFRYVRLLLNPQFDIELDGNINENSRVYIVGVSGKARRLLLDMRRRDPENSHPEHSFYIYTDTYTDNDTDIDNINHTDGERMIEIGKFIVPGTDSQDDRVTSNENGELPIQGMKFRLVQFLYKSIQQNGGKTRHRQRKTNRNEGKKRQTHKNKRN